MNTPEDQIKQQKTSTNRPKLQEQSTSLFAQLQPMQQSCQSLDGEAAEGEDKVVNSHQQSEDAQKQKIEVAMVNEELSFERDCLKRGVLRTEDIVRERENELLKNIDDELREKECLEVEIYEGVREREELVKKIDVGVRDNERLLKDNEVYRGKNEELEEDLSRSFGVLGVIKACLMRVSESLDESKAEICADHECDESEEEVLDFEAKSEGLMFEKLVGVSRMARRIEDRMCAQLEKAKKEKRELERSVMSLTEENRDANALLRIALVEKEAVEKSLSKLKGDAEQRRVPLLQFAERGLQRVGFGFIMGGTSTEQHEDEQQKNNADRISDSMESNSSLMSDVSSIDREVEAVSLASTVEKMIRNLRFELTRVRRELEDSRTDTERLQNLTENQARRMSKQTIYIKELEDREKFMKQNVEELLVELNATEAEAERWREACELEVEAGKLIAREHNKVVDILAQELEKTRTDLQVSDKKLKLKEEVANSAMAAQVAAERSLRLADRRVAGLHRRIEELIRQTEELESRQKYNKHRMRRICWPWQALNTTRVQNPNVNRMLPEMQAFL